MKVAVRIPTTMNQQCKARGQKTTLNRINVACLKRWSHVGFKQGPDGIIKPMRSCENSGDMSELIVCLSETAYKSLLQSAHLLYSSTNQCDLCVGRCIYVYKETNKYADTTKFRLIINK